MCPTSPFNIPRLYRHWYPEHQQQPTNMIVLPLFLSVVFSDARAEFTLALASAQAAHNLDNDA